MFDVENTRAKLLRLKSCDTELRTFGASDHRYQLNPPLTDNEVCAFETEYGVTLPTDFRTFLMMLGNGGAGPSYGIFRLGFYDAAGSGDEPWRENYSIVGTLREPFPHAEHWNLPESRLEQPESFASDEEEYRWQEELDAEMWKPELTNGAFPICHHGCAYRAILVVSGPEAGEVWADDRAGDGGIRPELDEQGTHLTFGTWYDRWLDTSLQLGR